MAEWLSGLRHGIEREKVSVRRRREFKSPWGELTELVALFYVLVFSYERYVPAYKPLFWHTNFWFESTDCSKITLLKFLKCLQLFGIHL